MYSIDRTFKSPQKKIFLDDLSTPLASPRHVQSVVCYNTKVIRDDNISFDQKSNYNLKFLWCDNLVMGTINTFCHHAISLAHAEQVKI